MAASSGGGQAAAASSPWVQGQKAKARLVTGGAAEGAAGAVQAFVEIALEPGWKTYWRTPGDAGGLPPSFDWSKSANLASVDVAFPAPQRFTDRSGNTIGYMDELVLPLTLKPQRPDAPISLVVELNYGVCKDICIPVDAELALEVPTGETDVIPGEAQAALERVPKTQDMLAPGDPVLVSARAQLDGPSPKITIEARFPEGGAGADAFLEAPDGLFLPLPELIGDVDASGVAAFEASLGGSDIDLAALKGKLVTVTLVSDAGASVATFVAQ